MGYTNLISYFESKKRYDWEDLSALAANDAYKHLPSGTTWLFFQASAPAGWSRIANGHNHKALRVVDGGGAGGSDGGGAYLLGSTISRAHSHTTPGHNHTMNHGTLHELDTVVSTVDLTPGTTISVSSSDADGANLLEDTGGGTGRYNYKPTFKNTNVTVSTESPGTDSQLADIVIKYFDTQICSKT